MNVRETHINYPLHALSRHNSYSSLKVGLRAISQLQKLFREYIRYIIIRCAPRSNHAVIFEI